jgi:TetR/AcrR family acrAB operon transcriptional repressor
MSRRARSSATTSLAGETGRLNGGRHARKELMATAIDCFARYGYQGTSIDRIASAAGVTKGALYYHFRDKEELLFEAVKDRIAEFEQRVVGSVAPLDDPAGALAEIARVCVHIATKNNLRRFILTLMVEALDTNPRLSQAFRDILRRFRGYLAGIVRLGQEQGVFRTDIDARLAAALFAGGVIGAELQHYQDPERVDLATAMQGVVGQLVTWLSVPPTGRATAAGRPARGERHARRESR